MSKYGTLHLAKSLNTLGCVFLNEMRQYYFIAVAQLETRKFKGDLNAQNGLSGKRVAARSCSVMSDLCSLDSSIEMCAICLEEYKDSQVGIRHSREPWAFHLRAVNEQKVYLSLT